MQIEATDPSDSSPPPRTEQIEKLADVARRFLEHCRHTKSLSTHTLRAYKGDLALFTAHVGAERMPPEIGREIVHDYVRFLREKRRLRESSIKRRLATVKVLFAWLEHEAVVSLSPFHRLNLTIRLPRRLPRALDAADMRRLLQAASRDGTAPAASYNEALMHLAVLILFSTGLRVSELVSIRLADISTKDAAILVRGKGNRERRVYLPGREASVALRRFIAERRRQHEGDYLFVTAVGRPASTQFIRSRLRSLSAKGAVTRRVTPHMLRHTAATQLLEAGVDIRFVQKLLGHSSIATTQIYTHVTDSMLKATLSRANTLGRVRRAG